MTRFAILTDEPERVLRWNPDCAEVSIVPFASAIAALLWEGGQRRAGATVLNGRGWRFGVAFNRVHSCESPAAGLSRELEQHSAR